MWIRLLWRDEKAPIGSAGKYLGLEWVPSDPHPRPIRRVDCLPDTEGTPCMLIRKMVSYLGCRPIRKCPSMTDWLAGNLEEAEI